MRMLTIYIIVWINNRYSAAVRERPSKKDFLVKPLYNQCCLQFCIVNKKPCQTFRAVALCSENCCGLVTGTLMAHVCEE